MPETETPPAPVQNLSKTPTLLETLAEQMDLSGAPQIKAKELPRIAEQIQPTNKAPEPPEKKKEKPPEKKAEKKGDESPPEKKPEEKAAIEDEWKKANETVAEKLFKKKPPKEGEPGGTPADKKVDAEKGKGKAEEEPPAPTKRKRSSVTNEAEITERAAAAASEAATRAVSKALSKPEEKPATKPVEDSLTPAERKQFNIYQELEAWKPEAYKGVTAKYLGSLKEIQDYVKTWAKENPGVQFDPNDEQHNEFFERIEPPVDEDDWDDAKANIRAREISSQAVKPLNDKLQAMEQERARNMMEPVLQQKALQGVHMLLNEFDPALAVEIAKPEGVKELQEKDPITAGILNHVAGIVSSLVSEIVRLHDPNAGIPFNASNPAHKEIADFILSQEARIAKLPREDQLRDGKRFIGRFDYRSLPPEQKDSYWFLDQDDITYLLAQKYAIQAKKIREEAVTKFNETAEKLGYKKLDGAKPGAKAASEKTAQPSKPAKTTTSPEAVSRTTVKTAAGPDGKAAPDQAQVILGSLFHRLRS